MFLTFERILLFPRRPAVALQTPWTLGVITPRSIIHHSAKDQNSWHNPCSWRSNGYCNTSQSEIIFRDKGVNERARASSLKYSGDLQGSLEVCSQSTYEILNSSIPGTLIHEHRIHGIRAHKRPFIRGIFRPGCARYLTQGCLALKNNLRGWPTVRAASGRRFGRYRKRQAKERQKKYYDFVSSIGIQFFASDSIRDHAILLRRFIRGNIFLSFFSCFL